MTSFFFLNVSIEDDFYEKENMFEWMLRICDAFSLSTTKWVFDYGSNTVDNCIIIQFMWLNPHKRIVWPIWDIRPYTMDGSERESTSISAVGNSKFYTFMPCQSIMINDLVFNEYCRYDGGCTTSIQLLCC